MVINVSRAKVFLLCKRKGFNNYHRNLEGPKSMNLVNGGAMHEGIAVGLATKDWGRAVEAARAKFDEEKQGVTVLPEQSFLYDQHWAVVKRMVEVYHENYGEEQYQVLQPECEFDVPLPGTTHNCIWLHHLQLEDGVWVEKWGPPNPEAILAGAIRPAHEFFDNSCSCWTPHRLVGKTDAVVYLQHNIWLLEHKSTAISGDLFWAQWELDIQPTAYLYGIWKSINIIPSGIVMNAVIKPSQKQVESWNSRRKYGAPKDMTDYISFERRPYLRTKEDLARCEQQFIDLCDEWEWRIVNGKFPLSNIIGVCMQYNRRCDYHAACCNHDAANELECLAPRKPDYVTEKLYKIANLPLPAPVEKVDEFNGNTEEF